MHAESPFLGGCSGPFLCRTVAGDADIWSLTGAPPQEITFKKLIRDYELLGWAPDENGIYLGKWTSSEFTALYAGLNGRSQLFWKLGTSPGYSMAGTPLFSPAGRHLAFTVIGHEANACREFLKTAMSDESPLAHPAFAGLF